MLIGEMEKENTQKMKVIDNEELKQLMDDIVTAEMCGLSNWEEPYEELIVEYRKGYSPIIRAKLLCWILEDSMYFPYKQEIINGQATWRIEKFSINDKEAKFVYNEVDKITKKDAMNNCWFRADGNTIVVDDNFIGQSDFLVMNKHDDYFSIHIEDAKTMKQIKENIRANNGIYSDSDMTKLKKIVENNVIFGDCQDYYDKTTGERYCGFVIDLSHKYGFALDFFDKGRGVISFTEDEYRRITKVKDDN